MDNIKINELFIGIGWFILAHIAVFFQLNGQFKWEWFKSNEIRIKFKITNTLFKNITYFHENRFFLKPCFFVKHKIQLSPVIINWCFNYFPLNSSLKIFK